MDRPMVYAQPADPGSELIRRRGPRPHTSAALPHMQLDQSSPDDIWRELKARSTALPYVNPQQSRMASPDSLALCLPDAFAFGPPEAFIDRHEFCHLHPESGAAHLTLPEALRRHALELGWAEEHPVCRIGVMPQLVLVYAPRDLSELGVVLDLIRSSYEFAVGI